MKLLNHDSMSTRECFGRIFPDLAITRFNTPNRGKVFGAAIESRGIGIQGEELSVDEEQWKFCVACPEFDGCYKLSVAKLLFQSAVNQRFH
jgi:hypothetical protein